MDESIRTDSTFDDQDGASREPMLGMGWGRSIHQDGRFQTSTCRRFTASTGAVRRRVHLTALQLGARLPDGADALLNRPDLERHRRFHRLTRTQHDTVTGRKSWDRRVDVILASWQLESELAARIGATVMSRYGSGIGEHDFRVGKRATDGVEQGA